MPEFLNGIAFRRGEDGLLQSHLLTANAPIQVQWKKARQKLTCQSVALTGYRVDVGNLIVRASVNKSSR